MMLEHVKMARLRIDSPQAHRQQQANSIAASDSCELHGVCSPANSGFRAYRVPVRPPSWPRAANDLAMLEAADAALRMPATDGVVAATCAALDTCRRARSKPAECWDLEAQTSRIGPRPSPGAPRGEVAWGQCGNRFFHLHPHVFSHR